MLSLLKNQQTANHRYKRNNNSLMGEKRIFELGPLKFREFLSYKKKSMLDFFSKETILNGEKRHIPELYKNEIEQYFFEYIKYGGYPSVVLEADPVEKEAILEEMVNSYINFDVRKAGIRDTSRFYRLMKLLAERVGDLLNMSELAQILNVSSPTVESYINLLQENLKIKLVYPYTRNHSKELSKMPKFYFCDLGIRNAILNNFDNLPDRWDRERFFENIVFNILSSKEETKTLHFWRTQNKHEVDFIINESIAFDARFNINNSNRSKSKTFKKLYPDMNLQLITYGNKKNGHIGVLEI